MLLCNCDVANCGINYFVVLQHCLLLQRGNCLWPSVNYCIVALLQVGCYCRGNSIFVFAAIIAILDYCCAVASFALACNAFCNCFVAAC